ncbi:MAG: integrase, partial [Proteobacteria bacterium]|nr:integrase [Pseudomonadota bacterium]
NVHNKQTAEFTTRFTKHEALQSDLKNLDILFNETQDRLIKIEAKQVRKYPQVSVVERAFLPQDPIRPNYLQDALIAIAGSILLSLSLVWFMIFLNRKDEANTAINLSGVHLYNSRIAHQNALDNNQFQSLVQQQNYAIAPPVTREISNQDLDILLRASNGKSKQLITLLLSGLSLEEITSLNKEAINNDSSLINISGSSARNIPLNPVLKTFFSEHNYCLADDLNNPLTIEDLAAILQYSIVDAGLPTANEINAATIRHNYIIYLVKQGIRLSDLELVFGSIPPIELSSYSAYSPPVPGRPFQEIDLLHPALIHLN